MDLKTIRTLLLFGTGSGKQPDAPAVYYGVEFTGDDPAGTRTGAAEGLVLKPSTDTVAGQNDFDSIYPWSAMRRCCCTLQSDGTVTVNAYQGQPGYAEDGTNGDVFVEIPLFYAAGALDTDPRISAKPLAGFRAPHKFENGDGTLKTHCYLPAFAGSLDEDGKLRSVAGKAPACNKTASQFLAAARLWGAPYSIGTSADYEVAAYLMVVACATRDMQSVFSGVTNLYKTNIAVAAARTDEAAVTLEKGAVEVGSVISIGTGGTNESVAARRMVTAVEAIAGDDAHEKVCFTGDAVTSTTDHKVWLQVQSTGSAKGVLGSCGSPVSNSDGRHSFVFFGLENPLYGNQWRFECDWKIVSGEVYCCDDPAKYQWTSTNDYTKCEGVALPASGYIRSLQTPDADRPWLQLPKETGGSADTGLADQFWLNRNGTRAMLRGGAAIDNTLAGPFALSASYNAAWSGWNGGASLSVPG